MKIRATFTTINQYLSYISIVLIGCAVIGLITVWFSVRELNTTAENTEYTQLRLAANDLENQLEILKDISESVSTSIHYQPDFLGGDPYRQVELLQHFTQYQSYSVLCKEYFLYYIDSGDFFMKNAKISFHEYFQPSRNNYLSDNSKIEALKSFIRGLEMNEQGTIAEMYNDYFLILYPLRLKRDIQTPTAVMGFVLNRQDIADRINIATGKLFESISIYYQNQHLIGENILLLGDFSWTDNIYANDDYIAARSDNETVIIFDSIPDGGWYSGLNRFRTIIFTFLCLSMILIIGLVILVIRRQNEPIRRMAEKIQAMFPQSNLNSANPNQIKQIEHAFTMIHQQNTLGKQQIKEQIDLLHSQTSMLKQQILLLILNGNINQYILQQMEELNIDLNGSFFCVFVLSFQQEIQPEILGSIERLSDEEQHYYTLRLPENQVIVICSFLLESTAGEAYDLLEAIAASEGEVSFTVSKSLIVTSLEKIPVSYYSTQASEVVETGTDSTGIGNYWYHNHSLILMITAIREQNRGSALEYLDQLMDMIAQRYPSNLLQRNIMADIVSKLVQTAYDLEIPILPEESGALLLYRSLESAHHELRALLNRMFDRLEQQKEQYENDLSLRIKKYIDDHALEYDISLNRIAEIFKLPPKQINHYIRLATNQTYKEYELSIRMQKAYELLTETSCSVMQISEEIGYMDVSSFIKAFKNATGTTPAAFRKNAGKSVSS